MVFESKKIPMETLGEYISEIRTQANLSITQTSHKTGIAEKFIKALEEGNYSLLPPSVYVCGFLKKLAVAYSIPEGILLDQYKKEQGIISQAPSKKPEQKKSLISLVKSLAITPKLISIVSIVLIVLGAVGYIAFQVSSINKTPQLVLSQPTPGAKVEGTTVEVVGITDPGSEVKINGQNILVGSAGEFSQTIGVVSGQKELTVVAENKFGKQSSQKVLILVDSSNLATKSNAASQELSAGLTLDDSEQTSFELRFTKPVVLNLQTDGKTWPEELVEAGSLKTFSVSDELIINTSDAGATEVKINNQDFGKLGRDGEPLTVPFSTKNLFSYNN